MITTVMFDLDGTLVHFEYEDFIKAYLEAVAAKVAHLTEPRGFVQQLLLSTDEMIRSLDPTRSNSEVFWDHFPKGLGLPLEEILPVIDGFYENDFSHICRVLEITPLPQARSMLETLIGQGYDVVIATNPVFPLTAINERLRWGNIYGLPYRLVTSYEDFSYCKPNRQYYEEILCKLNREPEECIMIGNNTCEDLVAGDLGITTYLVEDCLLDDGPFRREPDFRGSFSDLVRFIQSEKFAGL
jgi:FMN phosphatase YigB (HAD superfamily)